MVQKLRCVRYVTMCPHQPRPAAQAKTVGQTFKLLHRILFLLMSKVFAWAFSNILIHIKILFTSGISISSKTLSSKTMQETVFQQNYARKCPNAHHCFPPLPFSNGNCGHFSQQDPFVPFSVPKTCLESHWEEGCHSYIFGRCSLDIGLEILGKQTRGKSIATIATGHKRQHVLTQAVFEFASKKLRFRRHVPAALGTVDISYL